MDVSDVVVCGSSTRSSATSSRAVGGGESAMAAPLTGWSVLLCYQNSVIRDPSWLANRMRDACSTLALCGRVIVTPEGININVAGLELAPAADGTAAAAAVAAATAVTSASPIAAFIYAVRSLEIDGALPFEGTDFKLDAVRCPPGSPPFGDLFVKLAKEVVSSGLPSSYVVGDETCGGEHLSPAEWEATLKESAALGDEEELVLIDLRNSFEYAFGHFKSAVDSGCQYGVQEWRLGPGAALAKRLGGASAPKARVMMYCTGGVRCEKASAFLRASGVTCPVQQLKGGIHRYIEEFGSSSSWLGSNFVYDGRPGQLQTPVGAAITATCFDCCVPNEIITSDRVCAVCRTRTIVCSSCREKRRGVFFCATHRDFDGIFFPFLEEFSEDDLLLQRAKLHALVSHGLKGDALRARRKAGRRQIERIDSRLQKKLQNGSYAIGAVGAGWRCRTCGRFAQCDKESGESAASTPQLCNGRCEWEHREEGYAKLG